MLGNIKFYRKMIKNRNDNGILGSITSKLSQKDEDFSKKMVELFIKGLNSSYDEMESSLILINVNSSLFSISSTISRSMMN